MTTELTLQLDEKLVAKAKKISEKKGMSISQLISEYLQVLDLKQAENDVELTPLVKSLKGSLKGARIDESDYHQYLEEKHR